MKILIVEDEMKTGEYLSKGLTEAGFVVDHADNGLNGYHLAMTAEYDREHEKPRGSHRMMPSTGVKITTIIS